MNAVFGVAGFVSALIGLMVGVISGTFWAGFLAYMIFGVVGIIITGRIYTPYLRKADLDEV